MKPSMVTIFAVLALATVGAATGSKDAIGKVLSMISDLEAKVVAEGEEGQKVYEEAAELCEDRSKEIQYEIKTGKATVGELTSTISEQTAKIAALTDKIGDLGGAIAQDEKELKEATALRKKEKAEFVKVEKELSATVDTIDRAIGILEKEMGGASLVQLKNADSIEKALSVLVGAQALSTQDVDTLNAFAQTAKTKEDDQDSDDDTSDDDLGAPAPKAFVQKDKGGGIIENLEGLLEKATKQLDDARKEESKAMQDFEMTKQSLTMEVAIANADFEKAKKALAVCEETKATASGDLEVSNKDLAEDIKDLGTLHADCMSKANDFEEEAKAKGEELGALAQAKKIIKEAVGGAALDQQEQSLSFVQVSSSAEAQVVRMVKNLAKKQHSRALAQLSARMASAVRLGSPFDKIIGMINDMVAKLEKEAAEEANGKAYCDAELKETKEKKEDKEDEIEGLTTKIDKMESKIAKLNEEVGILQKELSELAATQSAMDKLRAEEKAVYDKVQPELSKGLTGIQAALKVLKDYYAKGEGSGGAGGGIISLLEVCEADFEKNLNEVETIEAAAIKEYEEQTDENKMVKLTKGKDVEYKQKEVASLSKAVAELSSDRDSVQDELDAVLKYDSQIQSKCKAKPDSYEERKKRREEEIAGLKEGLEVLEAESLIQKSASHHKLRGGHHA